MKVTGEALEQRASDQLKGQKLQTRYSTSDLSGAVRSAAKAAELYAEDYYVVSSNRYGSHAWHVSSKLADVTSYVTNSGKLAYRVTPSRDIFKLQIAA